MDKRILAIALIVIIIVLSITGFLLYIKPFDKTTVSIHTIMGMLLVTFILFHIANNKRELGLYVTGKGLKTTKKILSISIILIATVLIMAIVMDLPGSYLIYNWGNKQRNKKLSKSEETFDYQIINTSKDGENYQFELEVKKGSSLKQPLAAFWLADSSGSYIQTLYISRSLSNSEFRQVFNGKNWLRGVVRRPEALPIWAHQRNIKASDGLYIPLGSTPDLDGLSGATPTSNFKLKSSANIDFASSLTFYVEINQSFDWNEFYSKDRFPKDLIYSGTGQVGQPSLLYSTTITKDQIRNQTYFFLDLVGHGHHSGKTGVIFQNIDSITTAANIVDRIILKVGKN